MDAEQFLILLRPSDAPDGRVLRLLERSLRLVTQPRHERAMRHEKRSKYSFAIATSAFNFSFSRAARQGVSMRVRASSMSGGAATMLLSGDTLVSLATTSLKSDFDRRGCCDLRRDGLWSASWRRALRRSLYCRAECGAIRAATLVFCFRARA